MKILCCGDIHSNRENLFKILDKESPDLILCCGDWGFDEKGGLGAVELESIMNGILEKTVIASVFGNHDDLDIVRGLRHENYTWLKDNIPMEVTDFTMVGLNGIVSPEKKHPYNVLADEIAALEFPEESIDVVISHEPPRGAADALGTSRERVGVPFYMEYLKKTRPSVWVAGHTHELQCERVGNTVVLNAGGIWEGHYAIIDENGANFFNL
jgi:Icc-related predicted phosphoesterase